MAKEWKVQCKDCGKEFGYSDSSYLADANRGRSRPERCPDCRKIHNRQTNAMGLAYYKLHPRKDADTANISTGNLGAVSHEKRKHTAYDLPSSFDSTKFGITEDDVRKIFGWFSDSSHQVVVVEGPTGSGKSTVLPFRLISPPSGIPEDFFTRNGQIVITQPRIQATRNIPAYVAKELYGSNIGSGFDIGFRYSNHPFSDWRNKLVYITDGTLINWIVSGQIANLSLIMIDEAHERSLNIDLILGLLKKLLPRYPHLKLIIASATIDADMFIEYFGREKTGHVRFQGIQKHFVKEHYRFDGQNMDELQEDEYWMGDEPIEPPLLYEDVSRIRNTVAEELGRVVVWLLYEIIEGKKQPGDILGFLQGEKPIQTAVNYIREAIAQDKRLNNVYVCPLYTTLPQEEQDKALKSKPDPAKRRVVITTNVAETSLTVEDIIYVVDSGLINQDQWDPVSQTKQVIPVTQSRAGCKQRWGRAGRITDGEAYCLYTKKQFYDESVFPAYTKPQIQRSPLEQIVLTAKAAGIDDIENFEWIQKPPLEELRRAPGILKKKGALDQDGDLTEHGLELQAFAEEPALANLMILADRFSCAVEMATLLPIIKSGNLRNLFKWDRKWDAYTRRAVNQIHSSLIQTCQDDIELCLKLYAAWEETTGNSQPLYPEWALHQVWPKYIPPFTKPMREYIGEERSKELRRRIELTVDTEAIDSLFMEYGLEEVGKVWLNSLDSPIHHACQEAFAKAFYINHSIFRNKIEPERRKLLEDLSGHKKDEVVRPIEFDLIDKVRIIIAYCLPERICEGLHPTKAVEVAEGYPQINLYKLRGLGLEGEAAARQTEMPVQINVDSTLYRKKILSFVSCKQQVITHKLSPTTPPEPVNHASIVSLIQQDWKDWLATLNPSHIALGQFIAAQTRDEKGRLRNKDIYDRLFVDIRFPIHSRFECVVDDIDDKGVVWLIPKVRVADPPSFRDEVEIGVTDNIISDEDSFEDGDAVAVDLVDTYLSKLQQEPAENIEEDVEPAWASLVGDDRAIDDSVANQLVTDVYREVSGFIPLCRLIDGQEPSYHKSDLIYVEVVGFDIKGSTSPIVLFIPIPEQRPIDAFIQHHHVGEKIQLSVIDYDARLGDQQVTLVTREKESGLEILLTPEDICFSRSNFAVRLIPIGTEIEGVIEYIDTEYGRVRVSLLPNMENDLQKHPRKNDNTYVTRGVVKDISRSRVFVLLDWSQPQDGILHIVSAAGSGLYKVAEEFVIGETCEVKISDSQYPAHVQLGELPEEIRDPIEKQRRFNNLSWEDGELLFTGRMSFGLRNEIKSLSQDSNFCKAIDDLYLFSNRLFVKISMADWSKKVGERFKLDQWIEDAQVDRVVNFGAFVNLGDGFTGLVHKSQIPEEFVEDATQHITVGELLRVRIIRIDPEKQEIGLSLKEKQEKIDPFMKYKQNEIYSGVVSNITEGLGAFVQLERSVSGLVHKSELSIDWVNNVSDIVTVGQEVKVMVISIDNSKRRLGLSMKRAIGK